MQGIQTLIERIVQRELRLLGHTSPMEKSSSPQRGERRLGWLVTVLSVGLVRSASNVKRESERWYFIEADSTHLQL